MSTGPEEQPLRILIAGEGRSPIHEEAWQRGLEAAGCIVERFNWLARFRSRSRLLNLALRAQEHLSVGPTILALNADLVKRALASRPHVLLLYRPKHILASAVELVRRGSPGTLIVSYNNDDPFSAKAPVYHWYNYNNCLPFIDLALAYREKNLSELKAAGARRVHLLRSCYIPYLDAPAILTEEDHKQYDADVVFIGHYEPDGRIDALAAVAEHFSGFRLYGPDWDRAPDHPALRRFRPIRSLPHSEYVKAIQCSKIALAFFSGMNNDSYTRRVFEIPAIGTFMLSQRTAEMEQLFRPGYEAEYFGSTNELLEKIQHYCGAEADRLGIAEAGAKRVRVAGHDIFSRMRDLATLLEGLRRELVPSNSEKLVTNSDSAHEIVGQGFVDVGG